MARFDLITQARRRCEKGHYCLSLRDLTAQRTAQSLALWLPDPSHSIEAQQPGEGAQGGLPGAPLAGPGML